MKLLQNLLEFIFGCRHRHLSRVFTIKHRTYRVCFDCGREFDLPNPLGAESTLLKPPVWERILIPPADASAHSFRHSVESYCSLGLLTFEQSSPPPSPIVLRSRLNLAPADQGGDLKSWSCHLLSILRLHSPDCENCNPGAGCRGENMRARLEELLATEPGSEDPLQKDARGSCV
jgi:hypothetical protein